MVESDQLARLSFNQITADRLSLREVALNCQRAGISWIAPWRHKVDEIGAKEAARVIEDAGLRVSSLCRGGMFPAATPALFRERIDDNLRAIEDAATLGTDVLVLVCGPSPDKDIERAREMVMEGIAQIAGHAKSCGVNLGIEPLHPMYAAERSVIVTLGQANHMAETLHLDNVGVIVDVFHIWWDPFLYDEIRRSAGRILGFHVSDWIVPTPDMLMGRGMMGDGVIEISKMRAAVDEVGYTGPIEVEIFNHDIWNRPCEDVLAQTKERFLKHV